MFTTFFIDRPIFATVLSVMITLAGGVALSRLPVAQYPDITPPTVEVYCVYPGANARTVADTVAAPVEQQVNGVEDMLYMSSTCTNDGTYTLTVTFRPGVDLNIAQVLVQNRVNLAQPVLPDIVKRRGVTVKKKSPSQLMIINLHSPDRRPAMAAAAGMAAGYGPGAGGDLVRDSLYLSNYATILLRDQLSRLPGVGDITYLGQRDYSMRLWLDPDKLAVKNLSAADVVHAVEQQNAQVAAGQIGQPPAPPTQTFQYTINTLGRLTDESQFEDIILKTDDDGRAVRVKDVARVELGANVYDQTCSLDGSPSVALSVYQLPGTNAIETARRVRAKMEELKKTFPPGVEYAIVYDTTPFITESVSEVFKTLRDAVILVAIVMLVFLQSWRAAVIPLAAVPVAIVGTFAAMAALGYSVNTLTLFGLVLAVGIVVDDAIVVVEAAQHHIEHGLSPRDATVKAMEQVAGPVVAVGLVLTAVFVPCVFIEGIVGQFYRQFAVTIAVSTLISAFNSLTLSPALCALLLKPGSAEQAREPLPRVAFPLAGAGLAYFFAADPLAKQFPDLPTWAIPVACAFAGGLVGYLVRVVFNRALGWSFRTFNAGFDVFTKGYMRTLGVVLKATGLALVAYAGLLALTYYALAEAPTGFIPEQDKGYLLVNAQMRDGTALGVTEARLRTLERAARTVPGVRHTVVVAGQSILLGANAPNFGTLYVMLDDFPDRHDPERHAEAVAVNLRAVLDDAEPGAEVNVFGAPPVDGLGTAGGFKLIVEDPADTGAKALEDAARDAVRLASADPALRDVFTGFRADTPWLFLDVNREAAQATGLAVKDINDAFQVEYGSLYVNDFNRFGRTWQVNAQADTKFRRTLGGLNKIKVASRPVVSEGATVMPAAVMVPIKSFVRVKEVTGPVMVQRYNLYPAAPVSATAAPGVSSGQAIAAVERAAAEKLPTTMRTEWTELALLQLQTQDTAARAFILSVVLVFLVLAAQYESWALPLAVILVVPMCLLSAAVGVRLAGLEVNIFTQVGFIVLVGLACKNAILIVEFAKQRADAGADPKEAALAAAELRLRPIIMTSFAFVVGVVPLVLAEGAGAEMRHALGTAVFAGMLGVTGFGILLTPVFFVVVQRATRLFRARVTDTPAG